MFQNNPKFEKAFLEYQKYSITRKRPTSIVTERTQFYNHIFPYFKGKRIKGISEKDYINWLESLNDLKYSFKRNLHYDMCAFYNYLVLFYNVKNIPKIVGFSIRNYEIKQVDVWSYEEYKQFMSVIKKLKDQIIFELLYTTGIRVGELLALTFNDIDNGYLSINKNISKDYFDGQLLVMAPKSGKSRKILLTNSLLNKIEELKKIESEQYDDFNLDFFICGNKRPLSRTHLKRIKDNYCRKANVKQITIHQFRHSNASYLFENNISPITISKRLGHSSVEITLNTYVHQISEDEKKAKDLLSL